MPTCQTKTCDLFSSFLLQPAPLPQWQLQSPGLLLPFPRLASLPTSTLLPSTLKALTSSFSANRHVPALGHSIQLPSPGDTLAGRLSTPHTNPSQCPHPFLMGALPRVHHSLKTQHPTETGLASPSRGNVAVCHKSPSFLTSLYINRFVPIQSWLLQKKQRLSFSLQPSPPTGPQLCPLMYSQAVIL